VPNIPWLRNHLGRTDGTPRLVGHVESRFDPFRDSVSVGAILVHGLRRMYDRLGNYLG
jgi:hypothetical protein